MKLDLLKSAKTIDEASDEIINQMSFRERVEFANIPEGRNSLFKRLLSTHVRYKLRDGLANIDLMQDCRARSGRKDLNEVDAAGLIINEVYQRLCQTHRLRLVK